MQCPISWLTVLWPQRRAWRNRDTQRPGKEGMQSEKEHQCHLQHSRIANTLLPDQVGDVQTETNIHKRLFNSIKTNGLKINLLNIHK